MKRPVTRRWVPYVFLLAAAVQAQPAQAQLSEVKARLHGGILQPIAKAGDFFEFGPSVALDMAYPLSERLDLGLDLGWDYLNAPDIYASPTTNLWRYEVGLEADLLGDTGDSRYILRALAEAGGTTVRSHEFWLASRRPYTFKGETINQTSATATGGLRLGLRTPDGLTWWLTGKMNWLPIKETNSDALVELSRNQLDAISSAMSASITIGVTLW
jgi:hypothetical protein